VFKCPQLSDMDIGDELIVVGQVTWGIAEQGPVDKGIVFCVVMMLHYGLQLIS